MQLVIALAQIGKFMHQVKKGKKCKEGHQHQRRGRVDFPGKVAFEDQQTAVQRHRRPHEKTSSRRENRTSMPKNMITCTAQTPISKGSLP